MKEIRFSVNSWIFGDTDIETIAKCVKEIGADGIDVSGEPDKLDGTNVKKVLADQGLTAFCVNGHFVTEDHALNHSDAKMRSAAIDYGKKCVDLASASGSPLALLVPSQINKGSFFAGEQADWDASVSAIAEVAAYARQQNIMIVLECVNKYEVMMVRSLDDGIHMAQDVGLDNVKVIGDTFHMQMEEKNDIHNALRQAGGDWVRHLHIADNTRDVPGKGCFNWREIMIALDDIDYRGAVSFEYLPGLTLDDIFAGKLTKEDIVRDLGFSLRYLKDVTETVE